ncbi:hypothetical protein [Streptomyces sp. NBC_01481]|uniref:hypothetical protein n=1 Tax=Streptomyces sp. NBC_01481 TaxID=2975869 RepID=UPI002251AB3C|nr:hypothetical protein [Streptomyces sp. NBC_01481]MCX4581993.1 hypothetical protein [Streptomyces sp. NBC_01481]
MPRLELLQFLRRVQEQQLQQTDRWIAQEEQRAAEQVRAERLQPPRDPGWCVSYGIGADRSRWRSTSATAAWQSTRSQ